jgi:light-independent protochlorophyllide reductase subunit B
VEKAVADAAPELVLGTQMERHIAKRLGVPCAVISSPIHVQDVPARHSPQMGFEGANVIFDTWVHPLMMGLEEHLLQMFREDFEFADGAVPSHLHSVHGGAAATPAVPSVEEQFSAPEPAVLVADLNEPEIEHAGSHAGLQRGGGLGAGSAEWWHRGSPTPSASSRRFPSSCAARRKRNTERYAEEHGIADITVDTLYEAKAHYGR